MKILAIIPARGGSKGLPGKNIRSLCGKPLICYTIDSARSVICDFDICVSTDDQEIKKVVENYGLNVPFLRPMELASDTATTNDVLLHALDFYNTKFNANYDVVILLQPTSPLRTSQQIKEALELYQTHNGCDMVMGVKKSHAATVMCHENELGFLVNTLSKEANRRQDVQPFYEVNGAIYVINVNSLKEKGLAKFDKRVKYIMDAENSIDIDTIFDFEMAEFFLSKRLVNLK